MNEHHRQNSAYHRIYSSQAEAYHRMIAVEDVDNNLSAEIQRIYPVRDKKVLDLGTGTGRIPLILKGFSSKSVGLDLYRDMLVQNKKQMANEDFWSLIQGDMRNLPIRSKYFDIVIAGWAIGHFGRWYPNDWRQQVGRVVSGMHRAACSSGCLVIIETLSTGAFEPSPPTPRLAEYYALLESEWGFVRSEIRTDYQFQSVEQAIAFTEFFFGTELVAKIKKYNWIRLPEWTGVWSKKVAS